MAGNQTKNAVRRFKQNASCVCCVSRRDLLSGFAAVAAGAALPAVAARAQTPAKPTANTGRIDVHRHFVPPGYLVDPKRTYLNERSTIPQQLEDMDQAAAFRSRSCRSARRRSPTPMPRDARKFSRMANEYAAKLAGDHPGRFGQFAYLPFPDIEALAERDRIRPRYAQGRRRAT